MNYSVNVLLYYVNEKRQTFVLLQKRSDKHSISNPNTWAILGGRSKFWEFQKKRAAQREIFEETHIKVDICHLKLVKVFPKNYFPWLNIRSYFYFYPLLNIPKDMICREGEQMRFFNLNDLVDLSMPQDQLELIERFFAAT